MTDISSISFTSEEMSHLPHQQQSSTHTSMQATYLLEQLGEAIETIRDAAGMQIGMYEKISQLLRQARSKVVEVRERDLDIHRRCLEHIQILLYQKDYQEALSKIDTFKKMELNDISYEFLPLSLSPVLSQPILQHKIDIYQAIQLLNQNNTSFDLKHQAWLSLYMQSIEPEGESNLSHVTWKEVEEAQMQNFKRNFSIHSEAEKVEKLLVDTPKKDHSVSAHCLKSKSKTSNIKMKNKENQKSMNKLSPSKRSSQKRTTRKKPAKQAQETKTSKKITTPFIA